MMAETGSQPAGLEGRATDQGYGKARTRLASKRLLVTALPAVLLLIGTAAWFLAGRHDQPPTNDLLPASVVRQAGFPVYYYSGQPPHGFTLDTDSAQLSQGTLLFVLRNGNQRITVTEQLLPSHLSADQYPKTERVAGAAGDAVITYNGTRPIGALFAAATNSGGARSMILLTANEHVSTETMRDMLRQLRPASSSRQP